MVAKILSLISIAAIRWPCWVWVASITPTRVLVALSCEPLTASVEPALTAPAAIPVTVRFPSVPATLIDVPPVAAATVI
jgi:hypothetical protein